LHFDFTSSYVKTTSGEVRKLAAVSAVYEAQSSQNRTPTRGLYDSRDHHVGGRLAVMMISLFETFSGFAIAVGAENFEPRRSWCRKPKTFVYTPGASHQLDLF
jgi:hypothetical protein